MSEESKKDWERPWTTEEIVEHADTWNLACDTALLNTLKAFGDRILKKAEDVNDKIEDLNKNLSKIHLQVDLARNEFSSLRNTQFVECRVYEDDETILPEKPKDEGENNMPVEETVEDFREVVALGLEILDEFYDKVNVTVSDSEGEEEEGPSYVYRRKDPYINRRLPLVIGSEEWHKKWHVGLEETDSENENSSEKLSDSESEDNLSQNKDHSDVSSELSNLSGLDKSKVKPLVVVSTTQDILASSSESDTSVEPTSTNLSFAEQLAAKLGNVIKETGAPIEEPEVNKRPIQKKHSDFGALFSNEPPPLDDMREKEAHGIFSGGRGLFDDEDEDDLWNSSKTITASKQFSTGERKEDKFDKLDQGKGLFDEDSDDDIFGSKSYGDTQQIKQPYLQSNKSNVPVFDEEPPLFKEETNTKEKKKPAGGVSLFGKSDIFDGQSIGKLLKQRKASSSENSNEDEPEKKKSVDTNIVSPVGTVANESTQNKSSNKRTISSVPQTKEKQDKKSELFDDDIFGDDLFSSTAKESLFGKSTLFYDEDTVEPFLSRKSSTNENTSKTNKKSDSSRDLQSNDVLSPETPDTEYSFRKNSKSNISVLFDDSRNDDDNIFTVKDSKKSPKKEDYAEKKIKEKSHSETLSTKSKPNLFEDDLGDVDDLFSEISKKHDDTKIKKPKSFLFDNDEDDDFNIFMTKNDNKNSEDVQKDGGVAKTKKTSTKSKNISESTKPKISLFDDDLDDMDDLFSQFSKKDKSKYEKSHNLEKNSELFGESIILTPDEKSEDNNVEKNKDIEQPTNKKELTESEEPKPKENTITTPESLIKTIQPIINIGSKEEQPKEQNTDIHSDSIEKLANTKNNGICDTSETTIEAQKPVINNDNAKNTASTPNDVNINSTEKPVNNSNENSTTENVKKIDPTKENEINKKEDETIEVKKNINEQLPRVDAYKTFPKISIFEEPKNNEENVDIFTKSPIDSNPPTIEAERYKNSPNVLNFMDSIPPPDDDWDAYSDNTFDDMEPGNDGFLSRPSSLFDSEPPSLFFDDESDIPKGLIDDSFSSIPSVSQKMPPDVFSSSFSASEKGKENPKNDSNNGDKLEVQSSIISKFSENSNPNEQIKSNFSEDTSITKDEEFSPSESSIEKKRETNKPKLSQKPKLEDKLKEGYEDKTSTKPPIPKQKPDNRKSGKTSSLFDTAIPDFIDKKTDSSSENVRDEDQTDFLSSIETPIDSDRGNIKISENIITDKISKKSVSFDNIEENEIRTNEPAGPDSDDNMQSNITKITEKLQQISIKNEERTKPLVIPRKLSHNLNINVGALLPGSALPKRDSNQSPDENELSKSLPASRFSLNEDSVSTKPIILPRVSSLDTPSTKDYKLEKSVSFDGGTDIEVLQSVTKDRVRIPVKRRPSSRRARQKSLRESISEFRLDDPISDGEPSSESNEPVKIDVSTSEQMSENQKLIVEPQEQKIKEQDNLSTEISENVLKEINVLEDESEDLFKTIEKDIKTVNKANVISTKKKELFDDENKELFGEFSTEITKKMDSLFQDDLFENIKFVPLEKHESERSVNNESQDETSKMPLDQNKKKLNLETNDKTIDNDFLRSIENSKNINDIEPSVKKKSTIDNLFDSSDEDDIFKSTKVKETQSKRDSSVSVIGRIASKTDDVNRLKTASGKTKSNNLFDFSDDEDFLENFTSRKNDDKIKEKCSSEKLKRNSLFDDMDDDIFGTSSTENKSKQDVKPSVINKKPPKSTSLRKLENIEGEDDPLSALLK